METLILFWLHCAMKELSNALLFQWWVRRAWPVLQTVSQSNLYSLCFREYKYFITIKMPKRDRGDTCEPGKSRNLDTFSLSLFFFFRFSLLVLQADHKERACEQHLADAAEPSLPSFAPSVPQLFHSQQPKFFLFRNVKHFQSNNYLVLVGSQFSFSASSFCGSSFSVTRSLLLSFLLLLGQTSSLLCNALQSLIQLLALRFRSCES